VSYVKATEDVSVTLTTLESHRNENVLEMQLLSGRNCLGHAWNDVHTSRVRPDE